ncbi:MAG: hypothetical protein WCF57_15135 [Pyrinomonadaceae bacterium]
MSRPDGGRRNCRRPGQFANVSLSRKRWRRLWWLFLQRFGYRQVLYYVMIGSPTSLSSELNQHDLWHDLKGYFVGLYQWPLTALYPTHQN